MKGILKNIVTRVGRSRLIAAAGMVIFVIFALTGSAGPTEPASEPAVTVRPVDVSGAVSAVDAQPEPEPAPEPEPVQELELRPDPNYPLPWDGLVVQLYRDYPVRGTVVSHYPMESITAEIIRTDDPSAEPLRYICEYDPAQNILECSLDSADNVLGGESLNDLVDLAELEKGTYSLTLSAKNTQEEKLLYTGSFAVEWQGQKHLNPANFRDNYAYALEFFGGDTERFMFLYTASGNDDRKIKVDREWHKTYLRLINMFDDMGYIHVDAVPYFDKAIEYMNSTYIRVRSSERDSGVIPLTDIQEVFAGTFLPRLTRNDNYVSHHSFGTAIDLNAYTYPNKLSPDNWEVIRHAVAEELTYEGLKTEDGITYYDFRYSGQSEKYIKGVPREIQNYLIYELAFYRAGFGWGYYYTHNCDAMHYTLTELDPALHEAEGTGLRKVFEYAP